MIADGNGDFTRAIGMESDKTAIGFGVRSVRYAMVLEDGVVKYVGVDESGLQNASVESVLAFLDGKQQ
jgi:peroxiredoxin